MGQWFWIIVAVCILSVALIGILNVGAFVLKYRAGLNPARAQLVRGILVLAVAFVFPRILPYSALWGGVLVGLLSWEVGVWVQRVRARYAPMTTTNHP